MKNCCKTLEDDKWHTVRKISRHDSKVWRKYFLCLDDGNVLVSKKHLTDSLDDWKEETLQIKKKMEKSSFTKISLTSFCSGKRDWGMDQGGYFFVQKGCLVLAPSMGLMACLRIRNDPEFFQTKNSLQNGLQYILQNSLQYSLQIILQ